MSVIVARPSCCSLPATPIGENTLCVHGEYLSALVTPGNTGAVTIASVASVAGSKLLVSLHNTAETLVRTFEVTSIPHGSVVEYVVYGITGYKFEYAIDFDVLAGNIRMLLTNNDGVDIHATIVHIPVPLDDIPPQTNPIPITNNQTVVLPMSSGCVDVITSNWIGACWAITATSGTTSTSFRVISNTQQANMFSIVGDRVDIDVVVLISGTFISLVLTNNTANPLHIQLTRIPLSKSPIISSGCSVPSTAPAKIIPSQLLPGMSATVVDGPVNKSELNTKWIVVLTNMTTYDVQTYELNASLQHLTLARYATVGKFWVTYPELMDLGSAVSLRIVNDIPATTRVNVLRLPSGI